MTQQEQTTQICAQIVYLQDKATEASMECVKYMGKEGCTQKYLEALRVHSALKKEIKELEQKLNQIKEAVK